MRKLVESTFVTLDGVISDPQTWGPAYWDDQHAATAHDLLFAADSLLLGRVTWESFAQAWPSRAGADEYTDRINAMSKYVASRKLTDEDMSWNSTVIPGDVAEGVAQLKDQAGGNILKFGTGELDHTLLQHKLVDEYVFWLFPLAAGSGQRLFDGVDLAHLSLVDTKPLDSGIVVLTYTPKWISAGAA